MPRYYIPDSDALFDEWLENLANQLPAIATAIGGIPPALVTDVTTGYAAWDLAYDAHTVAHNASQAATEVKDGVRVTAQTAAQAIAQLLQKHPNLTDAQRETLGLTVPKRSRTPSSPDYVVNLPPPLLLLEARRAMVVVHFGVNPQNEKLNGKPDGIHGAKIWYRIETGPWQDVALDTNSPYNHNLNTTEPLNLEYRAQWSDNKGRTGIFSETAKCAVTP